MSHIPKIAILGFGSLMESLLPCCGSLLGTNDPNVWKTQIHAVKGSVHGLAEKQAQFPFPVSAGDSAEVLHRVQPDVILFSPPPTLAKELTETVLLPYYTMLREKSLPLPLLITFPPTPLPRYYCDTLGNDIAQATVLPCVAQAAGKYTIGHLGYSLVAMDERTTCSDEQKARLAAFIKPVGMPFYPAQDDLIAALTGMVTAHNVFELCFTLERCFALCGQTLSLSQIAGAMRRELRKFAPELTLPDAPGTPSCTGELPYPFENIAGCAVRAWYEGLRRFALAKKLEITEYEKFLRSTMDVLLMQVQTETKERLHQLSDGCATKGGLLEKALLSYDEKVELLLSRWCCEDAARASKDSIGEAEDPHWLSELTVCAASVAEDVFVRGNHLE